MDAAQDDTAFSYRFGEKITIENADRLTSEISARFDAPGVNRVIFDLENLLECSSYGLRLLLIFQRRAEAAGKKLVLYRPNPVILDLFTSTRLDRVFTIVETPGPAGGGSAAVQRQDDI
jgi:anti-anti-sigma factor